MFFFLKRKMPLGREKYIFRSQSEQNLSFRLGKIDPGSSTIIKTVIILVISWAANSSEGNKQEEICLPS